MPHQTDIAMEEEQDSSKPISVESDKNEKSTSNSDCSSQSDIKLITSFSHNQCPQTDAQNSKFGEDGSRLERKNPQKGNLNGNIEGHNVTRELSEMQAVKDTVNLVDDNNENSTLFTNGFTEIETHSLLAKKTEDEKDNENGLVPEIEVFHKSSSNSSSSSDDEKSENEKKKHKVKTKRKGSNSSEDSPRHMRRRIKELEQVQRDYIESRTLLDALCESKAELVKQLESEKQKNKYLERNPSIQQDEERNQLMKVVEETRAELEENNKTLEKREAEIKEKESVISNLTAKVEDLLKSKENLESGLETLQSTENSDNKQEAMRQFNQERIASLQKSLKEKEKELTSLKANLDVSGKRIQQLNAENSKLQAKLSNAETRIDTHAGEIERVQAESLVLIERIKKLEEQNSKYKEKIKANSLSKTEREEAEITQQKLNERIKELEGKVINVNGKYQKLQGEYQDALNALEAADEAYKQRDVVIEKYKSDIEEAENKTKGAYKELEKSKKDISRMEQDLLNLKLELKKAEEREQEKRIEREELRNQVKRAKENSKAYQAELEDVRSDLSEMTHEMNMAQARAKERGKKHQVLQLELTEVKETLQIARNVIDEKEKNMESIKGNLDEEKEKVKKLQQEIDRLEHVQTKLQYAEEDKARLEIKLNNANKDLVDTKENLDVETKRRKDLEQEVERLEKDNTRYKKKVEECESEIKKLCAAVEAKDTQLEEQILELIDIQGQLEEANRQYEFLCSSHEQDREKWEKWAKRAINRGQGRRRPKSAPSHKKSPPTTLPGRYEMYSPSHRRVVQKLGASRLNPSYMNSCRKVAWDRQGHDEQITEESEDKTDGAIEKEQLTPSPPSKPLLAKLENGTYQSANCDAPKSRYKRPASSYGIRSQPNPLISTPYEDSLVFRGYYNDMDTPKFNMENTVEFDEEELLAKNVVHKGDRVMIQSQVVGDSKLNVTGVVKFVGRVGKQIPSQSIYVGLKLDQPFGDNSGKLQGKQLFKCQPRHGKFVRLSDIHSVMNPRTLQYSRIRPVTADHIY